MSLQPEGFQYALAEHQGLTYSDERSSITGRRNVGRHPGYFRPSRSQLGL